MYDTLTNPVSRFRQLAACIGWLGAVVYAVQVRCVALISKTGVSSSGICLKLPTSRKRHNWVYARTASSDLDVFEQIFVKKEYDSIKMPSPKLIIDCGANVGYSTLYFLRRFPESQIIAVEPDLANYQMAERNLDRSERLDLVRMAVWTREVPLKVQRGTFRDGRDWSCQVRACASGEVSDVQGVTIAGLLERSGFSEIDLVKMDIEGTEALLFGDDSCHVWLGRTRNMAIELHGRDAYEAFFRAMSHYTYQMSRDGERVICTGITRNTKMKWAKAD